MNNLYVLMKMNILNLIRYNKFKNGDKKEKRRMISLILLMIFSATILTIYEFGLCFYLSDLLIEADNIELLLVLGIICGSLSTLCASLYKAPSYIFQNKDSDMLSSLPIKQSTILAGRVSMLLLDNYLLAIDCILIPCIVYFIKVDISIIHILFLIILMLAAPLIPTVISLLIAFFISSISVKRKNQNFTLVILNLMLIIVTFLISFNMQNIIMNLVKNSSLIIDVAINIYPPVYYFVDALKNLNTLSLFIFVILSILSIIVFILLFANTFDKINIKLDEKYQCEGYIFKKLKNSNHIIALLKKELKQYLSSTIYVVNTSIFMLLLFIFALTTTFLGYDKMISLLELNTDIYFSKIQIFSIITFCIIMNNTSCTSISIEGKNFWMLKSLPVNVIDIFKSKILLNILLNVPVSVISFLMIGIKLNFDIQTIIIFLFSIVLLSIFSAMLGLYVNLCYPRLEFTNDVQIVKQGASVVITMISNLLYIVILCGIGYMLNINNFIAFLIMSNIIVFISILVLYKLLKSKGAELFNNIS